jgi:hypothetical protein
MQLEEREFLLNQNQCMPFESTVYQLILPKVPKCDHLKLKIQAIRLFSALFTIAIVVFLEASNTGFKHT